MLKRLFTIILLGLVTTAHAREAELLSSLSARIQKLPGKPGSLIKSFSTHNQSYVYDQALAIIAFSKAKDRKKAEALLQGLASLQMADGSLYFSYYMNGLSPYPEEGDKRYAGALAWVALSVGHYQEAFSSKKFHPFQHKLLTYLREEVRPLTIGGTEVLALRFNRSDVKETPWRESKTAALEHNLDLYAAFKLHDRLNKDSAWKVETEGIHRFILSMWDRSRKHFWSGADFSTGRINKDEIYLDNQSWSMLALDADTLKELNFVSALELNCEDLFVEHEGVVGFRDRRPVRAPASEGFVWSEGTLGQVLAMKKAEKLQRDTMSCEGNGADELLASVFKMKKEDGGIGYATSTKDPDFTTSSSVAGTAWMYFASLGFNPFASET